MIEDAQAEGMQRLIIGEIRAPCIHSAVAGDAVISSCKDVKGFPVLRFHTPYQSAANVMHMLLKS